MSHLTDDTRRGLPEEESLESRETFGGEGFGEALWRVLASMRLALILLAIVALAAGLGTIIPQGKEPQEYAPTFAQFMSRERAEWLANLVLRLRLDNLYRAPWFLSLLYLMSINLIVCNARRIQLLWRRTYRPRVEASAAGVRAMPHRREWRAPAPVASARAALAAALRRSRYRVLEAAGNPATHIYADRGRFGNWGSYTMHLAVLLIFFGAAWGHHPNFGFDRTFGLAIGQTARIPQDILPPDDRRFDPHRQHAFTLTLTDFRVPVVEDGSGTPRQFMSDIVVEQDGRREQHTIWVNHPLKRKGLTLYQVSWGADGFFIEAVIRDPDGQVHQEFLAYPLGQEGAFVFDMSRLGEVAQPLEHRDWVVIVREFLPHAEPEGDMLAVKSPFPNQPWALLWVIRDPEDITMENMQEKLEPLGWVSETETLEFEGVTFRLAGMEVFSGFSVRRDPGVGLVWFGALIGFIGILLTFYVPHRIIRVRLLENGGSTEVVAGATCRLPAQFDREFETLQQALG